MTSDELGRLSTDLINVEQWLRESCTARHAERMANAVESAWKIVDDLFDEAVAKEKENER
jgi:hypothetical protein